MTASRYERIQAEREAQLTAKAAELSTGFVPHLKEVAGKEIDPMLQVIEDIMLKHNVPLFDRRLVAVTIAEINAVCTREAFKWAATE